MSTHTRLFSTSLVLIAVLLTAGCSKSARKERHLDRANRYFDAKDFKKSEIEYLNVLRLEPTNALVITRLATIHYNNGDALRALPFLVRAAELQRDNTDIRLKLAAIYFGARQFQKARDEVIYVLSRDPKSDEAIVLLADTAVSPKEIADSHQRLKSLEVQAGGRASWHLALAGLHLRQTNNQAADDALRRALTLEPQSSRVHFAIGSYYYHKGDIAKAEQALQKAAELGPLETAKQLRWVSFRLNTGATNEAKELLQTVMRQAPDFVPATLYRARIAFDERDYLQCSNIVQNVLQQDARHYEARLLRGALNRVHGRPAEAIKDLEDLRRFYPRASETAYQLALAYLQAEDRPKAMSSLQEAVTLNPEDSRVILLLSELHLERRDPASAVRLLESLITRQRGIHRAYYLLASAYRAQNRFDDALALYTGLAKNFPTNASIAFYTGLTLRQANRNPEARKAFDRAAELAPNDLTVIGQLVDLDLLDRAYQQAFQRVRVVLEKNPTSAAAKFLEAGIWLAQTNLHEAGVSLHKTIEWQPDFAPAYGLLAKIYLESGKVPEAIKNLEQVVAKNPKDVSTLVLLGSVYEQTGEAQKAADKYRDALKISPQFIPALNNFAYLLSEKLNNVNEAYQHATKARELAPESHNIADTLGWILYRRGEFGRALLMLQESATKAPDQAEIQFHLGMAAYAVAQEELSRTALKRALELKPDLAARADALDRLSVLQMDVSRADEKTVASLQDRIRKDPTDTVALVRLAHVYQHGGMRDKAFEALESARKASPASVPILVQLAELYSSDPKQSRQALALAREARKLSPADPAIAHVLGRLAYTAGDHTWACSLLQESAAKRPRDPDLLFDLAHAYYSIGRIDEAEESAQSGMQIAPASSRKAQMDWFVRLISFHKDPKKALDARAQVQEFFNRDRNYLPALFVAGLVSEYDSRTNDAKQLYEQAVKQYPDFAPAKKHLARLYTDDFGDQQRAFEYATKARQAMPHDPDLAKTLGKISFRRGDYQSAVRFLSESQTKRRDDPELLRFLGKAHYELKQKKEGKEALTRALALDPNGTAAPEIRKLLAKLEE